MIVLKLEKNQQENNEGYVRFDILQVKIWVEYRQELHKIQPNSSEIWTLYIFFSHIFWCVLWSSWVHVHFLCTFMIFIRIRYCRLYSQKGWKVSWLKSTECKENYEHGGEKHCAWFWASKEPGVVATLKFARLLRKWRWTLIRCSRSICCIVQMKKVTTPSIKFSICKLWQKLLPKGTFPHPMTLKNLRWGCAQCEGFSF